VLPQPVVLSVDVTQREWNKDGGRTKDGTMIIVPGIQFVFAGYSQSLSSLVAIL